MDILESVVLAGIQLAKSGVDLNQVIFNLGQKDYASFEDALGSKIFKNSEGIAQLSISDRITGNTGIIKIMPI